MRIRKGSEKGIIQRRTEDEDHHVRYGMEPGMRAPGGEQEHGYWYENLAECVVPLLLPLAQLFSPFSPFSLFSLSTPKSGQFDLGEIAG